MATQAKLLRISVTPPSGRWERLDTGCDGNTVTVDTQTQKRAGDGGDALCGRHKVQSRPPRLCAQRLAKPRTGMIGELGTLETPIAPTNTPECRSGVRRNGGIYGGALCPKRHGAAQCEPVVAVQRRWAERLIARQARRGRNMCRHIENARVDFDSWAMRARAAH